MPSKSSRPLCLALLALAALVASACGRLPFVTMAEYPAVGLPVDHLIGPDGDTLFARRVGSVTLVSPDRRPFDSAYVVLESAPRVWERHLGYEPAPVTAVLLRAPRRRQRAPRRPALPDSLAAARPVVWGSYVADDTSSWGPDTLNPMPGGPLDDRLRPGEVRTRLPRRGLPDTLRAVTEYGVVFPVEWHVAQQWLDADIARHGPLPAWLQAAIVSLVAEGPDRVRPSLLDRGLRVAPPIDSLLARECGPGWKPVPGESPMRFGEVSPTAGRNDPRWAPWLRDRCGYRLRVHANAVISFLVDEAGPDVVRALVDDARAGRPIEATLARFAATLPGTRAQLQEAYMRWVDAREPRGPGQDPRVRE